MSIFLLNVEVGSASRLVSNFPKIEGLGLVSDSVRLLFKMKSSFVWECDSSFPLTESNVNSE